MTMVILTACRRLERGASHAASYWGVVGGGGGGGVPGFGDGYGEVGSGGEEECEGAAAASVVGSWHWWWG